MFIFPIMQKLALFVYYKQERVNIKVRRRQKRWPHFIHSRHIYCHYSQGLSLHRTLVSSLLLSWTASGDPQCHAVLALGCHLWGRPQILLLSFSSWGSSGNRAKLWFSTTFSQGPEPGLLGQPLLYRQQPVSSTFFSSSHFTGVLRWAVCLMLALQ